MNYEIIPAILVENLEEFNERIEMAEDFAETVQWDIMDGQFVENETFHDIASLNHVDTVLSLEAHLMVEDPGEYLDDLAKVGVDRVIIHAEAADDLPGLVDRMKTYDFQVGVAINPETSIEEIESLLPELDVVMVMTVVPGASGQSFMHEQLHKVRAIRDMAPELDISVDGGLSQSTIKAAKEAGANLFCVNSAIFTSPDPAHAFELMKQAIE